MMPASGRTPAVMQVMPGMKSVDIARLEHAYLATYDRTRVLDRLSVAGPGDTAIPRHGDYAPWRDRVRSYSCR